MNLRETATLASILSRKADNLSPQEVADLILGVASGARKLSELYISKANQPDGDDYRDSKIADIENRVSFCAKKMGCTARFNNGQGYPVYILGITGNTLDEDAGWGIL